MHIPATQNDLIRGGITDQQMADHRERTLVMLFSL
jgi:hypothetical protein